jgi:adenylate cyclase
MPQNRTKRKLSAILSADVKGYSRLMGEDELATITTIKEYREVFKTLIDQYNGRVVDSPGDNLLAEFSSVVDAVECAVEIQESLRRKNAALSQNRRMEFRIGINLGDVIEDGESIYGEGINIAARLEGKAEGGGICISGTAYDQVKNKLGLNFEFLGKRAVKNISYPVRIYRIRSKSKTVSQANGHQRKKPRQHWKLALGMIFILIIVVAAWAIFHFYLRSDHKQIASVEKIKLSLPDKPSIAVLPFANLSRDPNQEYFADGISENIITALSLIPDMFVIARNSTFTYKGKPVKVQQVGEELGVRYVLEGSVQRSGDRIRVTAQLIDATTGHHLWAERYDRKLKDIFVLQDEITLKILTALEVKLTKGEQARRMSTTNNLEAWGNVVKGSSLFEQFEEQSNSRAKQFFLKASKLDPNWDVAWTLLGWTYWAEARFGWTESPVESIKRSVEIAEKVATINDTLPELYLLWSNIYLFQGDSEKAINAGKKAIALGPNNALSHVLLAYAMNYAGRFEEAIELGKKAIRLSPYSSPWYLMILNDAYRMAGHYEEALAGGKLYLNRCRKGECNPFMAHMSLARTFINLGRMDQARAHTTEMLKIEPGFSLEQARKIISFKDPALTERAINALRLAGLPEYTTLPLPDKPSIAVLPFTNMSDDPKQEYFSDGITEDLITDLSKISGLFVIARNSVFTYKGKPIKIKDVGRQLGVRYVLEGSVRKADDRVRITAQLVDAKTGGHMWAERYDRDLKDIFALQDEVAQKIVSAMVVKLSGDEQKRLGHRGTDNIEAYDYLLRGEDYFYRFSRKANTQAREMFKRAIELDPNYAAAYTFLGFTQWMEFAFGWSREVQSLDRAFKNAQRAISLNDLLPKAHLLLGKIYLWKKQHDQAIAEAGKTIALNPNNADGIASLGEILVFAGRSEEAIGLIKKAIRLNPIPPVWYFHSLGHAYFLTGHYEKAAATLKRVLNLNPNFWPAHIYMAASFVEMGQVDKARAEVEEVLKLNPKFSLKNRKGRLPYKDPAIFERLSALLGKAGLK